MSKTDPVDTASRLHAFLQAAWQSEQRVPTQREMAAHLDSSLSSVQDALSILEAQGHIVRQRYKTRGIRLVEEASIPATDETAATVLSYIEETIAEGIQPTQTEIANELYLTRREVRRCVLWLEAQGKLKRLSEGWQVET